jgi:hypothetical protein
MLKHFIVELMTDPLRRQETGRFVIRRNLDASVKVLLRVETRGTAMLVSLGI